MKKLIIFLVFSVYTSIMTIGYIPKEYWDMQNIENIVQDYENVISDIFSEFDKAMKNIKDQ